jgi:hypothetical protein
MATLITRLRNAVHPPEGERANLFSAATIVLSVAAVYLYFAGYIYCFFYYQGFGITLESLDLSLQYFFMRAFDPMKTLFGILLLAVFILALRWYMARGLRRGLMVLVILATFPALFFVSRQSARSAVRRDRCYPSKTIQFRFRDLKKEAPITADSPAPSRAGPDPLTLDDLTKAGDAGQLFLLFETKDRLVMYERPPCGMIQPDDVPAVHVYTLLRSDLSFSLVVEP